MNGAACSQSSTAGSGVSLHAYRCTCAAGFANGVCEYDYAARYLQQCAVTESSSHASHGGNCDVDVDECLSNPCGSGEGSARCSESGTVAQVSFHAYRCTCTAGYANGWCPYDFIAEYAALCTMSDSSGSLSPYAHGSTSVVALANRFAGTTYSLVFRLDADAHNLHAMFGSVAAGGMHFPAAYSFSDLKASAAPDAVCADPWLGSCPDLLLDVTDANKYASYLAVGGLSDAITSMNVEGASWGRDTALDVSDGAIYWKDTSVGCRGTCQVARLTVAAGSTFVAWANLQGRKAGAVGSAAAWEDRVWFSPVTGTSWHFGSNIGARVHNVMLLWHATHTINDRTCACLGTSSPALLCLPHPPLFPTPHNGR
jgi:hypothetical protein